MLLAIDVNVGFADANDVLFLVRSSTTNKIEGDTPAVCLPSESSKVPSSTINDLSPCPSPLIPVVGVRATRGNGHASSGAQKATFATPTCRHKHVDTIRFEHYPSENQRGQSVVAGRAPMRRFVQQSLPFSTSTRFVNSLVIKLSAQPRALLSKRFYRESERSSIRVSQFRC